MLRPSTATPKLNLGTVLQLLFLIKNFAICLFCPDPRYHSAWQSRAPSLKQTTTTNGPPPEAARPDGYVSWHLYPPAKLIRYDEIKVTI